jgi:phosphoglycolate phosphatase
MADFSAFVFDLDGTLIDSAPDIAAGLNVAFCRRGWPACEARYVERFTGNGPLALIRDILADRGVAAGEVEIAAARDDYLAAYQREPAGRTRFYPHVREDLDALRAAGIRLGVCTNKTHAITGEVLRSLGLDTVIELAVGADAVPASKPDPGHLRAVAAQMQLADGSWAYVGDTEVDRATAEAADVPFFVVPWGNGARIAVGEGQRLGRIGDLLRYVRRAA